MKILAYILIFLGIANIFRGIITLAQAPSEYHEQGGVALLIGFLFIGGAIYTFHRIAKKKQEQKEFDEWNGTNNPKL